jgi:hypothetical protein
MDFMSWLHANLLTVGICGSAALFIGGAYCATTWFLDFMTNDDYRWGKLK